MCPTITYQLSNFIELFIKHLCKTYKFRKNKIRRNPTNLLLKCHHLGGPNCNTSQQEMGRREVEDKGEERRVRPQKGKRRREKWKKIKEPMEGREKKGDMVEIEEDRRKSGHEEVREEKERRKKRRKKLGRDC